MIMLRSWGAILYVTESRKTVPNHTFLFHYIYYCNMNGITFSTLFHIITWNLMFKLSQLCNKYSGNTYAWVEIQLNTCWNTMDFMCDLEPFSKIWSHDDGLDCKSIWSHVMQSALPALRLLLGIWPHGHPLKSEKSWIILYGIFYNESQISQRIWRNCVFKYYNLSLL